MAVVIDMILAVAMVAFAPGAVAEFQLRIRYIGTAADGTFVGVRRLGLGHRCLVRTGIGEGDRFGLLLLGRALPEEPPGIHPPGHGEYIDHILAEKQEIVSQRNDGEQVDREGVYQKSEYHQEQIQQCEDPGLHGNNEQEQKLGIRVHGGISQEQAQIQIVGGGAAAEDHTVDVHKQDTGEVEQVEPERSPAIFDGPSKRVVAQKTNSGIDNVTHIKNKRVGKQPPNLAMEYGRPVKAENVIKGIGFVNRVDQIHQSATQGDIHH